MRPSEYMALMNEIETKFKVNSWVINDVKVWPMIRIDLATRLHNMENVKHFSSNTPLVREIGSVVNGLTKQITAKKQDYRKNEQIHKSDFIFLSHSLTRTLFNELWIDRFCDPFIEIFHEFGFKTFLMEYVPRRSYRIPRYSPSYYIQTKIELLKVRNKISTRINPKNISLEDYSALTKFLKGKDIKIELPSLEHVVQRIALLFSISEYYRKVLMKVKPKIGFVVYYYGIEGMAFNLACKSLGIPTIDIQHGLEGELHRAYGKWTNVPQDGYELLPSYFWCWTADEANAIDKWNTHLLDANHKSIIGGNLWLEYWREKERSTFESYRAIIERISGKKSVNILVTLQTGQGVPQIILDAIKKSNDDWKWWIRLHPTMVTQKEKVLGFFKDIDPEKFVIDEATDLPLFNLLQFINVHITEWSTTVLEAQQFGVPSILIHEYGKELFLDKIESGWCTYSENGYELLDQIVLQKEKQVNLRQKNISLPNKGILFILNHILQEKARVKS